MSAEKSNRSLEQIVLIPGFGKAEHLILTHRRQLRPRVELSVDNGEWMPAELRTPLSGQTWVMWRYDWPMQKGKHIFTVRCFEGDGTPQIAQEAPPDPSGATGLDARSVML